MVFLIKSKKYLLLNTNFKKIKNKKQFLQFNINIFNNNINFLNFLIFY